MRPARRCMRRLGSPVSLASSWQMTRATSADILSTRKYYFEKNDIVKSDSAAIKIYARVAMNLLRSPLGLQCLQSTLARAPTILRFHLRLPTRHLRFGCQSLDTAGPRLRDRPQCTVPAPPSSPSRASTCAIHRRPCKDLHRAHPCPANDLFDACRISSAHSLRSAFQFLRQAN